MGNQCEQRRAQAPPDHGARPHPPPPGRNEPPSPRSRDHEFGSLRRYQRSDGAHAGGQACTLTSGVNRFESQFKQLLQFVRQEESTVHNSAVRARGGGGHIRAPAWQRAPSDTRSGRLISPPAAGARDALPSMACACACQTISTADTNRFCADAFARHEVDGVCGQRIPMYKQKSSTVIFTCARLSRTCARARENPIATYYRLYRVRAPA